MINKPRWFTFHLLVWIVLAGSLDQHKAVIAQVLSPTLTVGEARKQAQNLGASTIFVHGHYWAGKEGSMIYDSYFKALLSIYFSKKFNDAHPDYFRWAIEETRKSNLATVEGHLEHHANGSLYIVADEIEFER